MGKKIDAHSVALAVYEGRTRKEAADTLGISERALYEHLKSYEVQAVLQALRYDVFRARTECLLSVQSEAVETLREIMQSESASNADRMKAAGMLLQFGRDAYKETTTAEQDSFYRIISAEARDDEQNGILHFSFGAEEIAEE